METLGYLGVAVVRAGGQVSHAAPPRADVLAIFGFLAAFATFVCFLYQRESRSLVFGLALSLLAMSAYGFLEGAWPLAMVVGGASVLTFRKWHIQRHVGPSQRPVWRRMMHHELVNVDPDSRISRMFGHK